MIGNRSLQSQLLGMAVETCCAAAMWQRWEAQKDADSGMEFFIDHEAKKTYWDEDLPPEGRAALAAAAAQRRLEPRNGAPLHASASAPNLADAAG